VGASRSLTRFDLNTQNLDDIVFPNDYSLVGCNLYKAVNQRTLRFIYQLDTTGGLVACTVSPQGKPTIHIIDVNNLAVGQTLDIDANFQDSLNPNWTMAAGLDGKIYVLVHNPEATINNLPQIDTASQEIILIYDVNQAIWSYKIKPKENTREILGVLPDGNVIFRNVEVDAEILEFNSDFQVVRILPDSGIFQGITSDGLLFFSSGNDYSDINIVDIETISEIVNCDTELTPK
jgi:hypothetical protein